MIGKCAKQTVTCKIVTKNGEVFLGKNLCRFPQAECPRSEGEGYDKCNYICGQVGHAEVVALAAAISVGADVNGAEAAVYGHTHSCKHCQEALYSAGVKSISVHAWQY